MNDCYGGTVHLRYDRPPWGVKPDVALTALIKYHELPLQRKSAETPPGTPPMVVPSSVDSACWPMPEAQPGKMRYPPELRRKVLDLVEAGRPIAEVAKAFGISPVDLHLVPCTHLSPDHHRATPTILAWTWAGLRPCERLPPTIIREVEPRRPGSPRSGSVIHRIHPTRA
jgi:hypothetical protein